MSDNLSPKKIEPADSPIKNSAFIDPLTGLYNRHYLEQFVPREIEKACLNNYPLSLLMIDVDKFKKINDSYGHLYGDKALTHAADIMKKAVRQSDTIIRYAGDEFMILLPGANRETASAICKNLLTNIEENKLIGDKDQDLKITLSIGYAIYPEDAEEQLKLIDMADKALYLSKKRGRNRFSSAKEVTVEEVSSLIAMESFPCRNFIDRREELDRLKQLFDTVIKSRLLQAAFISGPSGAGRSRVLAEIKAYIKDKGSLIYCDSSSPHAQDPYYLFAKGIGNLFDHSGIDNPQIMDIISKMPPAELSELSLIIPQLRKLIKKSADLSPDDTGRRFLLFEAFSDLLIELTNINPVLIIFDDINWADKASLELLRYFIKQENSKNLFILCSFSDNKLPGKTGSDALQTLLKETNQNANVTNIALVNLSINNTTAMIDAIFPGIGKPKEFSELIYSITKGNPYFIEEMLKFLVEKGVIFYQKDNWHVRAGIGVKDIPSSLDEIVKVRLAGLDDETKEMILQAAVIGKNFQTDTLKKIGDRNEGFVSELLERAKNMHLVNEVEQSGKFNFINENTQNILYGELNEEERNKIHFKIAQLLVNEHKDNLYDVAGEAAFHYSHAPREEKAVKFSKELLEKTSELFNPDEIRESLEQFTREFASRKEKIVVELSDKTMKEATKFVLFVHGTMKKMRLYPPNRSVRLNTIKEIHQILNQILHEVDSLILTEVEKSLVINGKRLSPAEENYAKAGDFLHIMREHGIKTVSLKKGVREDEMNSLISHFSQTRKDIINIGGWATVINKEGLEHVGIDELHFISVDEYAKAGPGKRPIHDFMLMEFLLGKRDPTTINKEEIAHNIESNPQRIAQTIMDIANITAEKDKTHDDAKIITDVITKIDSQILERKSANRDRGKDLAKVILELEPNLRNRVLDSFLSESRSEQKKVAKGIMGAITDDFIIDMITEKYKDGMHNPLIVKEFIDGVLSKIGRKKEILIRLEPKLIELDINKKDLAFVLGNAEWESLPVDRRTDMLLGLPENYYSGSMLYKVNTILEELDSSGKKKDLTNTISRFLVKTKKIGAKARENLLQTISEFINMPLAGKKEDFLQKGSRLDCVFGNIEVETDPAVFSSTMEIIKRIIDNLAGREPELSDFVLSAKRTENQKIQFIDRVFNLLIKRLKIEEGQRPVLYELINNSIVAISSASFIKILIYRLVDDTQKCAYNIKDLYFIFKDKLIDILIDLTTKKHMDLKDPFMEFVVKREIASLLMELKDVYSVRLRKILSETKEDAIAPLIKLIGDLQNAELIDSVLPFVNHNDPNIRTAVIQALSEIGGAQSIEILSKIANEEPDSNIRDLANTRLWRIKRRTPPQK